MSPVEPDILHAPTVEDAVVHQGQAPDLGLPAGRLPHKEADWAHRISDQLALDLPHQPCAFAGALSADCLSINASTSGLQ
jgi:hypothetical protein